MNYREGIEREKRERSRAQWGGKGREEVGMKLGD
jgi:hypothetical protein